MGEELDSLTCAFPPEHAGKNLSSLSHRSLRCLDLNNARPERDATILIGVLVGLLLAIPVCLTIFLFWRRGFFFCGTAGPATFSRAFYKRATDDDEFWGCSTIDGSSISLVERGEQNNQTEKHVYANLYLCKCGDSFHSANILTSKILVSIVDLSFHVESTTITEILCIISGIAIISYRYVNNTQFNNNSDDGCVSLTRQATVVVVEKIA